MMVRHSQREDHACPNRAEYPAYVYHSSPVHHSVNSTASTAARLHFEDKRMGSTASALNLSFLSVLGYLPLGP